MTWAVPAALALTTLAAIAGLVVVAWRLSVVAEAAILAASESARGVVEAMRPGAAVERAEADALREAGPAEEPEAIRRRREAVADQVAQGYDGEVAEGRAAMRLAGLDPDDHAAVADFNARNGAAA